MQVMGTNLNQIIGIKVQTFRKLRGFTQEELAERIGKTVETISNIERGKKLPSLNTLDDLSTELNTPLSDFVNVPVKKADREQLSLDAKAKFLLSQMSKKELKIAVRQLEALLGKV